MLFEPLDKLKRNAIFSAIILMALGALILIYPEAHVTSFLEIAGYGVCVMSIVMMLEFLSGKNSIMEYLKFTAALILALVGIYAVIYKEDTIRTLAWLFGILLIADGGRTAFHSVTYVRNSRRSSWWVITIFSVLLMLDGFLILFNPWWQDLGILMKIIGASLIFASLVSTLRLIWSWPIREKNKDAKEIAVNE